MAALRRWALVVAALGVLVVATACEVRVDLVVEAEPDGSGVVTVAVGFDDAALERLGDPADAVATDDLVEAGWEVSGPEQRPDGLTWLVASRAFDDPAAFGAVLAEVAGPSGPLAGSSLVVDRGPLRATTVLTGAVDLSAGLAQFGDPELTELLGGEPFGGLDAAIATAEGAVVEDMVDVTVRWVLDGDEVAQQVRLGEAADVVVLEQRRWQPQWWVMTALPLAGLVMAAATVARLRSSPVRRPFAGE